MYDPTEKNLKHKTDVLAWDDVPWEKCELNFRSPSAEGLLVTPLQAYCQLLSVTAMSVFSIVCLFCLFNAFNAPHGEWWFIALAAVATVWVAMSNWHRLPATSVLRQALWQPIIGGAVALMGFFAIWMGRSAGLLPISVAALLCGAIPLCLYASDQMTSHLVHWMSADPRVRRNTMVVWRNAWFGRFMTDELRQLGERGVSADSRARLGSYFRSHLAAGGACAGAVMLGLLVRSSGVIFPTGLTMVAIGTWGLAALAFSTRARIRRAQWSYARTLGLWFDYQRDTVMPPWVMRSPAGSQAVRELKSFLSVGVLAWSLFAVGLCDERWAASSLSDLFGTSMLVVVFVAIVAVVLAPAWYLLIGFIVTQNVAASCVQILEEVSRHES